MKRMKSNRAWSAAAAVRVRVLSALGVLGALALLAACTGGGSGDTQNADAVGGATWRPDDNPRAVESLTVSRGRFLPGLEASGVVSGAREAYVVSETRGLLREVRFELGDRVQAGQVLARVDDTIPRLQMEQARQQYESARLDLESLEALARGGNASQLQLARARSAANGAKALYESAMKAVEDSSLASPIEGFVASREEGISVGNLLTPGARVARIVDLSGLRVEVAVGEGEVGLIERGARAAVRVPAACDRVLEAAVQAVAAGSDPATGSYPVIVAWSDSCEGRIRAGMTAEVIIEPGSEQPVVLAPTSAVVQWEDREAVFVEEEGVALVRPVRTGRSRGNRTEVLEGLEGGETLLITGLTVLKPGDRVAPRVVGESGAWR